MKYLYLFLFVTLLSGCVESDPWRSALAAEHAQTTAQISQAQSADDDRRHAQTRLEGLQTQHDIVVGQAVVAHSNVLSVIVASTNETKLLLADKIIEAGDLRARPDYTPLYDAMMGVLVVVVAWMMTNSAQRPLGPFGVASQRAPQPADKPVLVYMTEHAFAYRLPDETMIRHRYRDDEERVYRPVHPFYQRVLTGGK